MADWAIFCHGIYQNLQGRFSDKKYIRESIKISQKIVSKSKMAVLGVGQKRRFLN
jgi:hypothetical protein